MIAPYVALFSWPLISIAFFKRCSPHVAVVLTILAGYLILPEKYSIDLPLLPPLNKITVPAITALVLAAMMVRRGTARFPVLPGLFPRLFSMWFLIVLLVGGAFMTVMTNGDTLQFGPTVLPALRPYDALSSILLALTFILPVLLARKYLASPQAHRALLVLLCFSGLIYSLFILVEARMSPLFHHWVYGYFPHVWIQHVRSYGWRPVVFLGHGLLVGIFLFATILSAAGLVRGKLQSTNRKRYIFAMLWLLLILLVSTNFGALLITLVLLPLFLFSNVKTHLITAAVIAGIFLAYPVARDTRLIPLDRIVDVAAQVDPQRAASFRTRLKNEEDFLAKTRQRSIFGWGGWGRSRTYDPNTGDDITIADGAWVITLSVSGWTGYIARFGILCIPVFLLLMHRRRLKIGPETSALALIVAGNLVDLIPNSSLTPVTAIVAGALWGRIELGTQLDEEEEEELDILPGKKRLVRRATREPLAPQAHAASGRSASYTRQAERIEHTRNLRK